MEAPQPEPEAIVPVEDTEIDAMEAAVIAQLVQGGVPYADAKAQVLGGAQSVQVDDEPEPPVVPQKSQDFSDDQVELYEMLEQLEEGGEYEITLTLPAYLMDWTIRKTLQEAFVRNNPSFLIPDFLTLMLKEQRAIDPTKGGKVTAGSSGPKDLYNPMTGKWS